MQGCMGIENALKESEREEGWKIKFMKGDYTGIINDIALSKDVKKIVNSGGRQFERIFYAID